MNTYFLKEKIIFFFLILAKKIEEKTNKLNVTELTEKERRLIKEVFKQGDETQKSKTGRNSTSQIQPELKSQIEVNNDLFKELYINC